MANNEEPKSLLQTLASNFFTDDEILIALDKKEFTWEEREIVDRERILQENTIRSSIMEMAESGSTPAQAKALELINSLRRRQY